MPVSIAIVDKPDVSADAFTQSIRTYTQYEIVVAATNGQDFFDQLRRTSVPDLALVELNLPGMDGFDILSRLTTLYPSIRVLVMSASDDRACIRRAMQHGAQGYLHRARGAAGLRLALNELVAMGRYFSDQQADPAGQHPTTRQVLSPAAVFDLNNREYRFLKMACSELTYNEIADQMCVSPRTVDGYREMVFQKMSVRSRVGMVIKAVRHKLIEL